MSKKMLVVSMSLMLIAAVSQATVMTSDDFSGDSLGAQWVAIPAGPNSSVTVSGGKVHTVLSSADGNYKMTYLNSNTGYTLPGGDFTVQIDGSVSSLSGWYLSGSVEVVIGSERYILRQTWETAASAPVKAYYNGVWSTTTNINSFNMQYKVDRIDSDIYFYAKTQNAETWTSIGSKNGVSTELATLKIYVGNSTSNGITMGWDNFEVVPEPATMCLLALGGLGIFIRKR